VGPGAQGHELDQDEAPEADFAQYDEASECRQTDTLFNRAKQWPTFSKTKQTLKLVPWGCRPPDLPPFFFWGFLFSETTSTNIKKQIPYVTQ
jgi:hypothetical protein